MLTHTSGHSSAARAAEKRSVRSASGDIRLRRKSGAFDVQQFLSTMIASPSTPIGHPGWFVRPLHASYLCGPPHTVAIARLRRLGHSALWLLAPFRRDEQLGSISNASPYQFDISFATLGDKIWFGVMLAMVIVVAVLGAVVYADFNGIPYRRVLLVIALTCGSWAVVAIYLRAVFDRPLGRTMSQIISYIIASFIAFLIGSSLIDLSWFDRILGVG